MTLSFGLILLAVLAYGVLHSLLASLNAKAHARHWFGPRIELWYRLIYNFIAVITLLPILLLPILLVDKKIYAIPYPWIILTLAIQILTVVLLILSLKQTGLLAFVGLRQLLLPEATSPARLVTGGLYRYVRHPQYTCGLVFIWLLPIMTWNLLALILGLTAYLFIGAYFDERKMLIEFGNAYADYQQRTPMFVPGLNLARFKHRS